MVPKSPTDNADKAQKDVHLSQREMEILSYAWQCFESQPKVNYEKLAEVAAFKNATSARVSFNSVKRKIMASGESSEPCTPTKPRGKRAAEDQTTPDSSKKAKLASKSSRKILPKVEEEDDDEKTFKKKTKAKVDEDDAELMSRLLGFDVKKKLEKEEDDDDDDESEAW
ncbi:uncharacterized protein F4807DRAFT_244015 [Annulohypoxylon truncatum]|uniref:uncharacterized protein n=1 Tax=Annulohypoxylon truncatum TaxID=327061 RepID=UPI0020083D41|nr:uncharacterized protein F4807DRAFT_244015 [Annulohypoxylon truncatum]KAI1206062.1 hypothetical protein F4807DRAFT_244015 [Annulohypoxylon truncatum]